MIYTIGYENLTFNKLKTIVHGLEATLIDCRGSSRRAKRGFGRWQLTEKLGARYEYHGRHLGNRPPGSTVTRDGIQMLANRSKNETLLLLCVCEGRGECHVHGMICGPHFPDAIHIYQDGLIYARDMNTAMKITDNNDPRYEPIIFGSLSTRLESKRKWKAYRPRRRV